MTDSYTLNRLAEVQAERAALANEIATAESTAAEARECLDTHGASRQRGHEPTNAKREASHAAYVAATRAESALRKLCDQRDSLGVEANNLRQHLERNTARDAHAAATVADLECAVTDAADAAARARSVAAVRDHLAGIETKLEQAEVAANAIETAESALRDAEQALQDARVEVHIGGGEVDAATERAVTTASKALNAAIAKHGIARDARTRLKQQHEALSGRLDDALAVEAEGRQQLARAMQQVALRECNELAAGLAEKVLQAHALDEYADYDRDARWPGLDLLRAMTTRGLCVSTFDGRAEAVPGLQDEVLLQHFKITARGKLDALVAKASTSREAAKLI